MLSTNQFDPVVPKLFLFRHPNIYLKMVCGLLPLRVVTFYNDFVGAVGAV